MTSSPMSLFLVLSFGAPVVYIAQEPGEPSLTQGDIVRGDASEGSRATVKTSSILAQQGKNAYAIANLVDRNEATAWCEGVDGDGIGEWLEMTIPYTKKTQPPTAACSLDSIALIPGYAKSAAAFLDNNRIRAFRVGPCGRSEPSVVWDLPLKSADPRNSMTYVPMQWVSMFDDPQSNEEVGDFKLPTPRRDAVRALIDLLANDNITTVTGGTCIRLTIQSVYPGEKHRDTCISEIVPIISCH